jgi:hypothetical protein
MTSSAKIFHDASHAGEFEPSSGVGATSSLVTPIGPAANDEPTAAEGPNKSEKSESSAEVHPAAQPDRRPIIQIHTGRMHLTYAEAEKHLSAQGVHFERSGLLVRVRHDALTGQCSIREVPALELARTLDRISAWQRFDKRAKDWVPTDPPPRVCTVLAAGCRTESLRPLAGLVRQPFIREDGSVCATAGYDGQTRLFGLFQAGAFAVIDHPTRTDAEAALMRLKALLEEFPFASEHDRAAALAAMLTAAVRPVLRASPMFHVRAHAAGTGKSYLAELIAAFAMAERSSPLTFPTSNDECDKVLFAELARSPGVIVFDNCTADIVPWKKLCTVLTEAQVGGRILGSSKTITVSSRVLILSSGNNVGPVADMARRCVTINLDAKDEMPATRRFTRPDLLDDVRATRAHHVMDALTIVRGWIGAGRPRSGAAPLGSYGEWSQWCREPLLWLGCSDPVASVFTAMEEDPERQRLQLLMTAWETKFRGGVVRVRDLIHWAGGLDPECAEVKELLVEIAGERETINRRRLGWWLKHHVGQVADGMRIEKAPRKGNVEAWKVVSV